MRKNMPQGNPISEQHARKPGQNPSDIDQDRGSFEPGSHKPGGDGQKTAPEHNERKDRPSKGNNPNSPQPASRDTDRREQRNMDDGYDQKRSDGKAQAPKPEDPKRPATKPQGTTEDQITNMESEGQAQEALDPQEPQQERKR